MLEIFADKKKYVRNLVVFFLIIKVTQITLFAHYFIHQFKILKPFLATYSRPVAVLGIEDAKVKYRLFDSTHNLAGKTHKGTDY